MTILCRSILSAAVVLATAGIVSAQAPPAGQTPAAEEPGDENLPGGGHADPEGQTADHQFEAQHLWDEGMAMRPSEYFRRNCYVNFWFEASGIALRHMIGVENIMWEADFPHPTSTYPHSRKALETSLAEVPAAEQKLMVESNAARVFGIDVGALALPGSVTYVA